MIGLDNIPAESLPHNQLPKQTLSPAQQRVVTVKHELAAKGMLETVTWSFTDSKLAEDYRRSDDVVLLMNPISAELDEMRPSLLPNLLMGAKNNIARGYGNVALFEVGPEFSGRKPGQQTLVAAGVRVGMTSKKHWAGEARAYDVFDVKADALAAIAAANGPFENAQITLDAPAYYHPGRSGVLRLGKNVLAYFGELHPSVAKKAGLKQRVYAFEVYLDNIPLPRDSQGKARKKLQLHSLQPVEKDLAFLVDKSVKAMDVITAAKNADRNAITDVRVFDVYGEDSDGDKKSIAISVTFQPVEKTFSDQELEVLMNKIIQEMKKRCNAELRQ